MIFVAWLLTALIANAVNEYNIKIDIKLSFSEESYNTSHPLQLTLTLEQNRYFCEIIPDSNTQYYKCVANKIESTQDEENYLEISYDSPFRVYINNIKIFVVESDKNDEYYYEFSKFCVPKVYNYVLKFPYGQAILSTLRHGDCEQIFIQDNDGDIKYHFQKFGNIGIGSSSLFSYHKLTFQDNIQQHKNEKKMEVVILPPPLKEFALKTTDLSKDVNPQTKDPVKFSVVWFNKYYECIVHPLEPNTTYSCFVNNTDITSVCDVDPKYYGTFSIIVDKGELTTNSLVMDHLYAVDIANSYFGFNAFCISPGLQHNSAVCGGRIDVNRDVVKCDGFVGYHERSGDLIKCDRSGIDVDSFWKYALRYDFVEDLYLHQNETRQSLVYSAVWHQHDTQHFCYDYMAIKKEDISTIGSVTIEMDKIDGFETRLQWIESTIDDIQRNVTYLREIENTRKPQSVSPTTASTTKYPTPSPSQPPIIPDGTTVAVNTTISSGDIDVEAHSKRIERLEIAVIVILLCMVFMMFLMVKIYLVMKTEKVEPDLRDYSRTDLGGYTTENITDFTDKSHVSSDDHSMNLIDDEKGYCVVDKEKIVQEMYNQEIGDQEMHLVNGIQQNELIDDDPEIIEISLSKVVDL